MGSGALISRVLFVNLSSVCGSSMPSIAVGFMFRYLPGIFLLQIVTVALAWASLNFGGDAGWWHWLLPAALVALVTAFWFSSIGRAGSRDAMEKLRTNHAREREKLKVEVEKDKARIQQVATNTIRREERRASRRANLKVGGAFLVTTLAGVLLLITELFTLGFMTITTAAGAMGGYMVRWRQTGTPPTGKGGLPGGGGSTPWIEGEKLTDDTLSTRQRPAPRIVKSERSPVPERTSADPFYPPARDDE